jgi:predicted MFS family arabinose efflux permease
MLDRSSRYIVTGYAITALGALINVVNLWSGHDLWSMSSRYDVEVVANLLSTFAVLGGWWFLSQLNSDDERQRRIIRRGFLFLGCEQLLSGVSISVFASGQHTAGFRYFVPMWAPAAGGVVAAIGFLIGALGLGSGGRDVTRSRVDDDQAASE